MSKMHSTKQRLIDAGLRMLLEHGYNESRHPGPAHGDGDPQGLVLPPLQGQGGFRSASHRRLHRRSPRRPRCLSQDTGRPPLTRVRRFFEMTQQKYREEVTGLPLGGLGQELSGVSEVFRRKIEWCFSQSPSAWPPAWRGTAKRRDPSRLRRAADGRPPGRLLGRCGSAQPPSRNPAFAERDARLLHPLIGHQLSA